MMYRNVIVIWTNSIFIWTNSMTIWTNSYPIRIQYCTPDRHPYHHIRRHRINTNVEFCFEFRLKDDDSVSGNRFTTEIFVLWSWTNESFVHERIDVVFVMIEQWLTFWEREYERKSQIINDPNVLRFNTNWNCYQCAQIEIF